MVWRANWFHHTQGGGQGNGPAEPDGLMNLGVRGSAGHNLVTSAVGLKARGGQHIETGAAWEFPLTNPSILDGRVTAELILRY